MQLQWWKFQPAGVFPSFDADLDPLTAPTPPLVRQEVPGVPDQYAYKERLPQSFPHGLPASSMEPGTTDLHFPPSNLFLEPPLGNGEHLQTETPLQTVAQLQAATKNLQELVVELAAVRFRLSGL